LYKSKDVSVANLMLYGVFILIRNTRHLKANSGTVHWSNTDVWTHKYYISVDLTLFYVNFKDFNFNFNHARVLLPSKWHISCTHRKAPWAPWRWPRTEAETCRNNN